MKHLNYLQNELLFKQFDHSQLKSWFLSEKRDLPWRTTKNSYAIWVSEIMLQQTQVAVVIPYFLNWMERFPTIDHLASASLDEVLKMWEGLGYYSRARNLHEGAQYIVKHFNGELPHEEEHLKKIKGLGPYTIGAILSFAFHQKKAAVDGNVLRVLTRYFGLTDDISKASSINNLRSLTQILLPDEEPWVINEALIELGAKVCQRKAKCLLCPLKQNCVSFKENLTDQLPFKSKKTTTEYLYRSVAVIQCGSNFLVRRGQKGAIMSDLYEFPYFEINKDHFCIKKLKKSIKDHFELNIFEEQILSEVAHGFTRFHVHLYPALFKSLEQKMIEGLDWLPYKHLKELAFSSGHRRIFLQIEADD